MFCFKKYSAKNDKNQDKLIKSINIFITAVIITGSIFYYSYNLPISKPDKSVSGKIDKLADDSLKDINSDSNLLNKEVTKNNIEQDSKKLIEKSEKFSELSFIVEQNIKDIIKKYENTEKVKDIPPDTVSMITKLPSPVPPKKWKK